MIDIARRAGVSVATVSRVINRPELVDPDKRKAVADIIRDVGYRPNALAQGLVSQSSKTIGVVINQFSSSYYGLMLDGVESASSSVGFKTIAESSRETVEGEYAAVASLHDRQCEAIVLHSDMLSDEQLRDLMEEYPRIVLMNRPLDGFESRCVYVDNVQIGRLAGDQLCASGHHDIAVVTGPMEYFECCHRLEGFTTALATQGAHLNPELIFHSDFTVQGGLAAMKDVRAAALPASAVFFMNDEMAAGAMEYCLSSGVSVPDEVSILGCDDMSFASYLYPKLTTIRQPLIELGKAAGVLAHAIATNTVSADAQHVLQVEVMERASICRLQK